MALKITLVAGSGMIVLEKDALPKLTRPSQNLMYDIQGATLSIYEKRGGAPTYIFLSSGIVADVENSGGTALLNETAVRAYLDPIIGVQKTV